MAVAKRTVRSLTVLLGAIAFVLLCAIGVVAGTKGRVAPDQVKAAEPESRLAEDADAARRQVERDAADARKKAESRIASLEDENSELKDQIKSTIGSMSQQAKKLAVAEQEAVRLREELAAAQKDAAESNKKYEETDAELQHALAQQNQAPAANPPAAKPPRQKPHVAHAGGNKNRRQNNSYRRGSATKPSSPKLHDPGIGPRLTDKSDDATDDSDLLTPSPAEPAHD